MLRKKGWMEWVGMVLWVLAALSLILAWVAVAMKNLVFGLEPLAWYWNALVLGVLSLPCSMCPMAKCPVEKEESAGM